MFWVYVVFLFLVGIEIVLVNKVKYSVMLFNLFCKSCVILYEKFKVLL